MAKAPFANCDGCPLRTQPFVPSVGPRNHDTSIIVVGEAPGYEETLEGAPFVGVSGKLLQAVIEQHCNVAYATVYRTNAVLCRPPANRTPTDDEVSCCLARLEYELESHPCNKIVTLGKTAKLALLKDDVDRGDWYPWRSKRVLPTWHPAYVLRKPSEMRTFARDMFASMSDDVADTKWPDVRIATDAQHLETILSTGAKYDWWSVDIETNQITWYDKPYAEVVANKRRDQPLAYGQLKDPVLMVAICWCTDFSVIVPMELLYDDPQVRDILNRHFAWHQIIMHNGSFDTLFLESIGISIQSSFAFDTMLAHYCLQELPPHGLKELAQEYLNIPNYETQLVDKYLSSRNDEYSKVPFNELAQYAALDVMCTLQLKTIFERELAKQSRLVMPFKKVLMTGVHLTINMRRRGMKVDLDHIQRWQRKAIEATCVLVERMREMCDHPDLNPNSSQQMAVVIWDEMKLAPNKQGKNYATKPRSTAEDAVNHLGSKDPITGIKVREGNEFIDLLMEYRHIAKMKSSYFDNLIENADVFGRVHADILLHGTEIGRLSMRGPALQTIPREADVWGRAVRASIIAETGCRLIVCDYSQAELRVLAALSQDPFLLRVYRESRDLHSEVAAAMYGANYTKEQRVMCKMFNFAYAYGGTEYSFARDAGLPLEKAKAFVREYDKNMAVAKTWKLWQFKRAKSDGFVETRFGRRRHFPLITEANLEEVRKACVHMPVASTASDLTLMAAARLEARGIPVVLLVHDSIIVEVPEDQAEATCKIVQQMMIDTATEFVPEVPWKADVDSPALRWCEPPSS